MFDPSSRYYNIPTVTLNVTAAEGETRSIAYIRRRFIPDLSQQPILVEHSVSQGERLDNITASYLNDPLQFWRVCDSNAAMHPLELTETGRVIAIRLPSA